MSFQRTIDIFASNCYMEVFLDLLKFTKPMKAV